MRVLNFNIEAAADILRFARTESKESLEFAPTSGWKLPIEEALVAVPTMIEAAEKMYAADPDLMAELMTLEGIGPGGYNGNGRGLIMTPEEVEEAENNAMLDALAAAYDAEHYVPPVTEEVLI